MARLRVRVRVNFDGTLMVGVRCRFMVWVMFCVHGRIGIKVRVTFRITLRVMIRVRV